MAMSVIIVGGGKVGTYLASLLLADGYRVKVIEERREEMPRLQQDLPAGTAVLGSGTDPNVLETAGIRQANVLAAMTGDDEINLVATTLARFEFGVPRTIARVNNPKNAWMFTPEMGVDVALNQADLMAHLIAEEMSLGDMMTLLKLRKGQYSLVEEKVDPESAVVGKALADLSLPTECVLTAVIRKGQVIIPRGDVILQPADEVLALVHASQVSSLAVLLGHLEVAR
ncbi:MAG TPA: TrkA family potassium uptake protein [Anaerolineae bacterium]|jgi:trk system potassium uptake protein TrkA|nr:TrkA family potassium uptake protein [Anaerolineae bacterium]